MKQHRIYLLLIGVWWLASCTAPTRHIIENDGSIRIEVGGSTLVSPNRYQQKITHKAEQLCNGLFDYTQRPTAKITTFQTYINKQWMDVNSVHYSAIIRCRKKI